MAISPGTPTGWSRPRGSVMYTRTFGKGLPTVTVSPVGQTRDAGAGRGLGGAVAVPDRAAPLQQRLSQPVGERFADGRRRETTVATPAGGDESPPGGGRRHHVGRTAARRSTGSAKRGSPPPRRWRAPGVLRMPARKRCRTSAMSKLMDTTDSTVSPAPMPNSRTRSRIRFVTPRCSMSTGLGRPVEPDV